MAEAALRKLDRNLPRLDMRSPELIARQNAARSVAVVPARRRASEELHIAFTGLVADGLRRHALSRGESPQVLAAALLARLLETDMAGDLIEGRAEFEAGGQGRRPFGEAGQLTLRQCAVIHLVGIHAGLDGWCHLTMAALTGLLRHESKMLVPDVLHAMERRGIVMRGRRMGRGSATPWALSELGRAVFDVLAGEVE